MLLSEGDATEKDCPFFYKWSRSWWWFFVFWKDFNIAISGGCHGSDCMAWRPGEPAEEWTRDKPEDLFGWTEKRGTLNPDKIWWSRPTPDRRGYCGLGGEPEI